MNQKVLVTGVNGFIGAYVVRRLLAEGHDVLGASVEPTCALGIPYRQADISNREEVEALFADTEISSVVHLAALVHNKSKDLSFATYERINYTGAKNVFECAREHGVKRVLFASTIEVYGETEAPVVSESAPRNPKTFYAVSKKMAEDCLFGMKDIEGTVMRFAPAYARDFTLNLDKRIYAVKGKWAYYLKDGSYSFHFCSVNNILDFIAAWLEKPAIRGVFNIADAEAVKAIELVRLAKQSNPGLHVLHLPYGLALPAVWCVDKLLRLMGRKDSMLSYYNFKKLFRSSLWDIGALKAARGEEPKWNVKNTLY